MFCLSIYSVLIHFFTEAAITQAFTQAITQYTQSITQALTQSSEAITQALTQFLKDFADKYLELNKGKQLIGGFPFRKKPTYRFVICMYVCVCVCVCVSRAITQQIFDQSRPGFF